MTLLIILVLAPFVSLQAQDGKDKTVVVTGRLVKEDGSPVSNASVELLFLRNAKAQKEKVEYGERTGALTPIVKGFVALVSHGDIEGGLLATYSLPSDAIREEDEGRFRLELALDSITEGAEFMLSAQLSPGAYPPEPNVPLFDGEGNLIRLDFTKSIDTLDLGDVTGKQ
jgi:hypothetical protein